MGSEMCIRDSPQLAIAKTLGLFHPKPEKNNTINKQSFIHPSSRIGDNVTIQSGVVIEENVFIGEETLIGANVHIGPNSMIANHCQLNPNVTIYHNVKIGSSVLIHSGAVIGSDGFGFISVDDYHEKIPQTGDVVIGDHVEIGSNCSIDRATIGSTIISDMTKLDNLVHIAHNVKIGKGCLLTSGFAWVDGLSTADESSRPLGPFDPSIGEPRGDTPLAGP